jgi:hypothetical protein
MPLERGGGLQDIRHTVTELFSPPRVNSKARETSSGLAAATSLEHGGGLGVPQRREPKGLLEQAQGRGPWVAIGSPLRTACSVLNNGLNKCRTSPDRQRRQMAEGRVLLAFALSEHV